MTGTHSIVVPLDGSAFAERALPVAAGIAARRQVPLRLVRVHVPAASEVHCAEGLVIIDDQRDLDARIREGAYLVDQVHALDTPVPVETMLLDGHVSSALARDAKASGAALVVMTTHGRSGLNRLWLGSVADGLVRQGPAPVLLVRPTSDRPLPRRFERVLVPLDDSPPARSILDDVPLVAEPGAELVLLTVIEPSNWQTRPTDGGPAVPDEAERESGRRVLPGKDRDAAPSPRLPRHDAGPVSRRCADEIRGGPRPGRGPDRSRHPRPVRAGASGAGQRGRRGHPSLRRARPAASARARVFSRPANAGSLK